MEIVFHEYAEKTCTKCRKTLSVIWFSQLHKSYYTKMCNKCRLLSRTSKRRNKCVHGSDKHKCKDCGGSSVCTHSKIRSECVQCGGGSVCLHKKRKTTCIKCKGGSVCEHNRQRRLCRDCEGRGICEHDRQRRSCIECKGSNICYHERQRSKCKECKGSQICHHNCQKGVCSICSPQQYLAHIVSCRVRRALKGVKDSKTVEYLGIPINEYRKYLECRFEDGMSWNNFGNKSGDWQIDHIIPIMYRVDGISPSIQEIKERLHYTNTQPMWAKDNMSKKNKRIGK